MKNFMIALALNLLLFASGWCTVEWYLDYVYPELNGMSVARAEQLRDQKATLSVEGHRLFYDHADKWYHFEAMPGQRALWMQMPTKDGKVLTIMSTPTRVTDKGEQQELDLRTMQWRPLREHNKLKELKK